MRTFIFGNGNFFKGFIPLEYCVDIELAGSYYYTLNDKTYLYEAFDYIKRLKTMDEYVVIMELKTFIDSYFGFSIKEDNKQEFIKKKILNKSKLI